MTKHYILLFFCLLFGITRTVFSQSAVIAPGFIQIPATSTPPGCSVATDKGKQYFNTSSNKMFYCNGTTWLEYMPSVPAHFMAYISQNLSISNDTDGNLTNYTEVFDEGNDFASPFFIAPQSGIYHFDVSVKWGSNTSASNYVEASLKKCDTGGSNCETMASSKLNNQVSPTQAFGVNVKLTVGERIKIAIYQTNSDGINRGYEGPDGRGNIPTYFSGHLVK